MNREIVLGKLKLKTATIPIPEWGGDLTIRELNAPERFKFAERFNGASGQRLAEAMVDIVIACSQNGSGPLFKPEDFQALVDSDGKVLQRIAEECLRLSGLTADAVEASEKN